MRHCVSCSSTLGKENRTGYCIKCMTTAQPCCIEGCNGRVSVTSRYRGCASCRRAIGKNKIQAMRDERVDDERRQRASGDKPHWLKLGVRVVSLEGKSSATVVGYNAALGRVKIKLDSSGGTYSKWLPEFLEKYAQESR